MKLIYMRWLALLLLVTVIGGTPFCFSQQPASPFQGAAPVQTARTQGPAVGNVQEHPLKRAIDLARAAMDQVQRVEGCTFILVKREHVDGKLTGHEAVFMKVRSRPFSVYAHTLGPVQPKGREAIYVEGRNGNKAQVHVTGFQHKLLGTMSFDPKDPNMMEGSRYPMTTAGFQNMMTSVLQMYEAEAKHAENDVQIFTGAKVDGRACTCVQNSHPVRKPEFFFQMTRVFYDEQTGLPIRWEAYDWPSRPGEQPPLVEEYTYRNVQLNPGLTDADFDVNNPAYGYK
jgi:hypothetical protein